MANHLVAMATRTVAIRLSPHTRSRLLALLCSFTLCHMFMLHPERTGSLPPHLPLVFSLGHCVRHHCNVLIALAVSLAFLFLALLKESWCVRASVLSVVWVGLLTVQLTSAHTFTPGHRRTRPPTPVASTERSLSSVPSGAGLASDARTGEYSSTSLRTLTCGKRERKGMVFSSVRESCKSECRV